MSEASLTPAEPAVLANDPAARSPTGEILNQTSSTEPVNEPAATPAEPAATETVPESYTFAAVNGIEYDAETIAAATPIFKELGLTQSQADKLVAFQAARDAAVGKNSLDAANAMRESWRDQISKDPEIGSKLDQVKETVGRAYDSLGDPKLVQEFKDAMNLTGAGDHPAFVKALYKFSQAITEGQHVAGGGPSSAGQTKPGTARPSLAQAMYPHLPSQ